MLIPSTLGVLVFGFISGSIVVNASGVEGLQAASGFVKYIVYNLSGIGAQWFSQMLFVISLLLLLVRKVVTALLKEERKSIQKESSVYVWLVVMFFLLWGASKLLNTPVVEFYCFGIYTVAFLLGYYVFSQDIVIEVLKKWRFVSTLAAVVSGVYFIYRAYGIYYGHSSLLSTWYANLFTPLAAVLIEKIPVVRYLILGISIE